MNGSFESFKSSMFSEDSNKLIADMFTSAMSTNHRKKVLHIGKQDICRINASYSKYLEKEKYDPRVIKDFKAS